MKKLTLFSVLAVFVIALCAGCAATSTRESTGGYVDDSAITAKVKADLVRDPVTKAREISVETFKGVVQLSGFVSTEQEKDRAEDIARGVKGVMDVKNNLILKQGL